MASVSATTACAPEPAEGLGWNGDAVEAEGFAYMAVRSLKGLPISFPGTTGADYVDYFIGDPVTTPLSHAAHFSEKLAQMPLCYQPNDAKRALPAPSRRADWGVP